MTSKAGKARILESAEGATIDVILTGILGAIAVTPMMNALRLTDIRPIADPANNEECIVADVSDRAAIERMMEGVSAVVYMTGVGGNTTIEDLFRVAYLSDADTVFYGSADMPALVDLLERAADQVPKEISLQDALAIPAVRALSPHLNALPR